MENGIDPALFHGSFDGYKITAANDPCKYKSITENITALRIVKEARFGNSVKQLVNVLRLAERLSLDRVYLPDFWYLTDHFYTEKGIEIVNKADKNNFEREKLVLEGVFFYQNTLKPLYEKTQSWFDTLRTIPDSAWKIDIKAAGLGSRHLVIHIRSGDIFGTNKVHSGYGQPPLSFYKKILISRDWEFVSIVYEDDRNPVIEHLIQFCCHRFKGVKSVNGELNDDLDYLLKAENLVASRGTFSMALSAISRNLNKVYYFDSFYKDCGNSNVNAVRLYDTDAVYKESLLSMNWKNSSSQRALMLNYPMDSIAFDEPKDSGKSISHSHGAAFSRMDIITSGCTLKDINSVLASGYFDAEWYVNEYPDVAASIMTPVEHYLNIGASLNRSPSPEFDAPGYRIINHHRMERDEDPLLHYIDSLRSGPECTCRPPAVAGRLYESEAFTRRLRDYYWNEPARFDRVKVSVIMPVYNRHKLVTAAINSVQQQRHGNWELLIIDDGSEDGTADVVRGIARCDQRIRLIVIPHSGAAAARNRGLKEARGGLVAFLDSDNTWRPDYLRNMLVFMLTHDYQQAYAGMLVRDDWGRPRRFRGEDFDREKCLRGNYVDINIYCCLREGGDKPVFFDESIRRVEDWDFILRRTDGKRVGYAPFIGCDYLDSRLDSGRVTNNTPRLFDRIVRLKNSCRPPLERRSILEKLVFRIAIKIPAPRNKKMNWGDFHFAESLSEALARRGHETRIDFPGEWYEKEVNRDDVVIVLRGLSQYKPRKGQVNIMWNISHPDQISYAEYESYDWIYVASQTYAPLLDFIVDCPVLPLLQATDKERFYFRDSVPARERVRLLFVGNSRKQYRPVVAWSINRGLAPEIHGEHWEDYVPHELIRGSNIDNRLLAVKYASADVVLNDHWDSMREYGFISNRLFDVVASGARVVSDAIPSASRIFGPSVLQVKNEAELEEAVMAVEKEGLTYDRHKLSKEITDYHSFDIRAGKILNDLYSFFGFSADEKDKEKPIPKSSKAPFVLAGARLKVSAIVHWNRHPQSSAYIRLLCPMTSEVLMNDIQLRLVAHNDYEQALSSDIVIVQRTIFTDTDQAERFADQVGKRNKGLVVDIDDGFEYISPEHPEFELYGSKNAALSAIIARADRTWCSTRRLRDAYSRLPGRLEVMKNMLDPRIWRDYQKPRPDMGRKDKLRFLYMGTPTHFHDFTMIEAALEEAHRLRPGRFKLTIIGAVDNTPDRPWLKTVKPPRNCTDYPRFVRWLRSQPRFDAGLAPLVNNPFNDCKSDLKFLDYAALGILPVVSDCISYRETVKTSAGGVLVPNTHEAWRDTIIDIVDNFEMYAPVTENALRYVWRERSVDRLSLQQRQSLEMICDEVNPFCHGLDNPQSAPF